MKYLMKNQTERDIKLARRTIAEVARKEHKSIEEIKCAIMEAIQAGMGSADPAVQAMWKKVPCKADIPTPEELIIWAYKRIQNSENIVSEVYDKGTVPLTAKM